LSDCDGSCEETVASVETANSIFLQSKKYNKKSYAVVANCSE
jgi:hypothetical protein